LQSIFIIKEAEVEREEPRDEDTHLEGARVGEAANAVVDFPFEEEDEVSDKTVVEGDED